MKTLIIAIFSEKKDLFDFKEKFADELKRDDVIFIENPNNKTDLENQLEIHRGEFDRVVVSVHGGQGEIPTMTVGEDKVTITDVIKAVNKDNEGTLKKIHLTSCFIGSHFDRIEQKDNSSSYYSELNGSLWDGQILVLHGDSYTGDIRNSLDQRLKEIVKSLNYSAINPTLLRGGEVHVPSTTIENGTALLFAVAWAEIAKYVNGRFTPTTNPKPKNGEKVEEEDLYKKP